MRGALAPQDGEAAVDIILASGSPRRRELLSQMGLTYRVVVSDADEAVDSALSPSDQVSLISRLSLIHI